VSEPSASDGGRVTHKQVYEAVGDLRKEVSDKIDVLAEKIDVLVISHEHRLTQLETVSTNDQKRLFAVEKDVSSLKEAHAIARGHVAAYKAIVGVLIVMCGGLITDLIMRAVH
jgi:hypothetical protein